MTLTVNCFSPDGPIVWDLLWSSLSCSHFQWLSSVLIGLSMVVFRVESGFSSDDFLSCSHKLPGDQMLCVLDLPLRDRFKGASSSVTIEKMIPWSNSGFNNYWSASALEQTNENKSTFLDQIFHSTKNIVRFSNSFIWNCIKMLTLLSRWVLFFLLRVNTNKNIFSLFKQINYKVFYMMGFSLLIKTEKTEWWNQK